MRSEPLPALSRLFLQWRPSLSRYFRKRRAAAWDTDDLLQEVWLRLQRSEAHAPEIANPEAYLFTIAANLMREHALLRQRSSQRDTCLDEVLDRLAVPCEADAQVHRAQRRQRLAELMARLPPKCRAAMVLRYRDELGYQEIAEQLQISSHMVKKYIIKGLAVCRQGMARYA